MAISLLISFLVDICNGDFGQNGGQHVENDGEEEEEQQQKEDNDYDATGFTSDEDDEVREIRTKYNDFMVEARMRGDIGYDKPVTLDIPGGTDINNYVQGNEFGDGISYFDLDHEASYDEDCNTLNLIEK